MGTPAKFDLEEAISTWRSFMSSARGLSSEDVDELEVHLRDEIDELVEAGYDPADAFRAARESLGNYDIVEHAFDQVYWRKLAYEKKLKDELKNRASMLKNYIQVALRGLRKQKIYSFINILGLAIGIASTLVILLFVYDELSYDDYHEHADSVYRVAREWVDESGESTLRLARISAPIAPALRDEFPKIENAVRIWGGGGVVSRGTEFSAEPRLYFAGAEFFDVLSASFVRGDAEAALTEPYTVVLTEEMALKWFGEENPIGEIVRLDDTWDLTVTAVVQDPPHNTHFNYDFLVSIATLKSIFDEEAFTNWTGYNNYATYVRLAAGADPAELESRFPPFLESKYSDEPGELSRLFLQPLTDIHLRSDLSSEFAANGDIANVYLFSIVAFFILLIACFNFMSLATARAFRRVREIGVRKALGAARSQLAGQFMGETFVLSMFALVVAAGLTVLLASVFDDIAGTSLRAFEQYGALVAAGLVGLSLLAGLIAGTYPALYLSGFHPAEVLKGRIGTGGSGGTFRKVVVVAQFVISIALISGAAVVYQQIRFVQQKDLGFESEHLAVVPRMRELRDRMLAHPNIESVSDSRLVPSDRLVDHIDGSSEVGGQIRPFNGLPLLPAGPNFVETYGLEVVAGRALSEERVSDSTEAYILNESAVRKLGWSSPQEAVGEQLTLQGSSFTRPGTVTGVVKDFHFESLREEISPLVLFVMPERHRLMTVKFTGSDPQDVLEFLEGLWAEYVPSFPFQYRLIEQDFDALYTSEERTANVIGAFAILAILVACLGLFGLASFMAQQRTKEIGIRKALGASVTGVVGLLTKDYVRLIAIAFLIAAPASWYVMKGWLSEYAYAVDPGPGLFLAGGLAVLVVALLSVSYQAVRAARTDPVKSLRFE